MEAQRPNCPACGAPDPLPIIYGYPGLEMMEQSERGEISLGGCLIFENQPEWHCARCEHEFVAGLNG
jgi:hypothetical protein